MKILIIRFRRVGDSVLAMSLCHSLKKSFPQCEIHYVLNSAIAPLYDGHPDVDEVIPFTPDECKGWRYVKKVWRTMHQHRYDVIIDMRSTVKTLLFSLFSLRTKYRIGRKKAYNIGLQNYRIPVDETISRVRSNFDLMKPLEAEGKLVFDEHFPLHITEEEKASFRKYMESEGIDFHKPVFLIACCTRIEGKAWRMENMAEVLRRLMQKVPDAQLIFNYGGDIERRQAEQLFDMLDKSKRIFLNIEAKSLRELCALCSLSSFFFGNEGGPRHIAQSFDVPSFAIYPPNINKRFWLPENGGRFTGISPDDFVEPAKQEGMTYAERFNLLTVENVWAGLEKQCDEIFGSAKIDNNTGK